VLTSGLIGTVDGNLRPHAAHGIWLDRGELAALIEFVATGAMAQAEGRLRERADARKRLDAWGQDLRAVGPGHYRDSFSGT
jgi:Zn-finger nucleic acid-binding protein